MHQKDTDKLFSFTSNQDFKLEKISSLLLREVQEASFLKRTAMYENTDFDLVQNNLQQVKKLTQLDDV